MEIKVVRDLTVLDFPNICRVCLWKGELTHFENEPVFELFKAITNIDLDFEFFPKNVCIECIGKLENISNFINTSKLNDLCLRQIFQKNRDLLEDSSIENEPQLEIVDDEFERAIKDENKVEFETDKIHELNPITKLITQGSNEKNIGKEALACSVCNTVFSTKKDLIEHTKKNSDCKFGGRYECQHCGRKFLVKYKMKIHMKSHSTEKPYECKVCGKKFKVAYNVTRHDNIAHKGIKPYKCKECGKEFARLERLTNHSRVHMEKRPYICEECGQTFHTRQGYCVHRKIHSSNRFMEHTSNHEYKYQCYVCRKNYSTKTVLQTHLMKHRGEKKFLCNVCGGHFYLKSSLDLHYRIHTGEKPFVCKTCNKSFRSISAYKVHSLTHTGQRYYQCDICSKTFVQSSHLRRHSMVHTGEKPYSCSYCGKQFTQNNNLKAHLRIHTGETPYSCSICHKTFHDSSGMKKHTMMHLRR